METNSEWYIHTHTYIHMYTYLWMYIVYLLLYVIYTNVLISDDRLCVRVTDGCEIKWESMK